MTFEKSLHVIAIAEVRVSEIASVQFVSRFFDPRNINLLYPNQKDLS